ncbi:MAG: hypothetical protein KGD63_11945 [Candidatus Lokiarchaeota archaeon]|nr:hypothetical protein [Candidatus Lokiarchaeota archaeon]
MIPGIILGLLVTGLIIHQYSFIMPGLVFNISSRSYINFGISAFTRLPPESHVL